MEKIRHPLWDLSSVGFVSDRPDQDRGMILVPLIAGIHPVQHHRKVLHPVPRYGIFRPLLPLLHHEPDPVALHIVFRDEIEPELIAEPVEKGGIRIMAGPDRIDIVSLHEEEIPPHILLPHGPSPVRGELVPVRSEKDDAPPVETHKAVL